ncbi:MAG: gliding motility lipoprotein GldD [Bacteroidetes bacterium HGW-Bacteroidetes-21]|jgi:gliding motility-associated lipoprotein GldD|nr:MAG: gliding motility lipoprotein GldD [Bacteroidetes bacterium HGW-Bacteroidetes-21]
MKNNILGLFILLNLVLWSCGQDYVPKPRGYFRIDFPEKKYVTYDTLCPFAFEYPAYAIIERDNTPGAEPCFFNISFPAFNAKIHMSYKSGKEKIAGYIEDSHNLVYKHTIKADAINEKLFIDSVRNVYSVLYEIKGDAASSLQFYATDSLNHFIRGALYFNSIPNKDSLAPVIKFIEPDIQHIIETLQWKN